MSLEQRIKIAILYENWGEEETAPPPEPEKKRRAKIKHKKKKREKHDFEEIFEALEKVGHQPSYQILDGTDKTLTALARCDADLFFNLVESYAGDDSKEMHVAAYLDLLGRPYTGAGPQAMYLAGDKALAKKIFEFHGVRTPFFAAVYRGTLEHSDDIKFPLIVKPTSEDASIGIDKDSVVGSVKELMQRIQYVQEEFDSPALIEEYIEGREIYGAILGNDDPEVLPLVELDLSRLPAGMPRVAGTEVKWEKDSEAYKSTKSAPVEDLDEETTERLSQTALAAYHALKLRDYARVDMRLTPKGEVYVIEANPNPWLSSNSEFYMAAKKSGRSYADMVSEIVDLARSDRRVRDLMREE
jgi:D-alanine-D-alanine ligase